MKITQSAGGVVLNKKGQVLVVNQRGRSWSLPKGHLENGEDALSAARREIYEESGVKDLTYVRPLGTYQRAKIGKSGGETRDEMKELTFFLFQTRDQALQPVDPDNPEARWVDPEQVAPLLTHLRDRQFFLEVLPSLTNRKS
jgi:bis(5'-nucleosidyl)-tetraphosphatase